MHNKLVKRQLQIMQTKIPMYRQYRVGELPDIQISYKDVLLPLMALVRKDSTIATEVFVEVFTMLYTALNKQEARDSLGEGVFNMLR